MTMTRLLSYCIFALNFVAHLRRQRRLRFSLRFAKNVQRSYGNERNNFSVGRHAVVGNVQKHRTVFES